MSKARQQQNQIGEGMIFSLIKQEYWNALQSFCSEYYQKTSDPLYIFWKGFAQYKLGNINAAINDLLPIQQKKEISYACIVALLFYQNQVRNIDREQIDSLRAKERDQRRNGSDRAISIAIYFFTFTKESKKAQDLLEQKKSGSILFVMADIWYSLWNAEEEERKNVQAKIDRAYEQKDKVAPKITLFLARCMIKNSQKKFEQALQALNEGIVFYPTFIPFMTEKFVSFMALGQWQQFQQAALQVSQRDTANISAVKALAFYQIVRQGNADNAYLRIKELQSVIQKKEGKNPKLLYQNCHLFLRVCGRNQRIVQLLQKIMEKCRKYDPLNADYVIEQGCQLLMLNRDEQAYKSFQEASSLDQAKLESITGMIECKLLQDQIDDAQNQIQFVNVMQQTIGRTPTIAYLQALLTIKKPNQTNQSMADFYKILDGALKLQISYSKTLDSGFSYYSKLNPDFLFSIAELYLRPVSMKQMIEGNQNSNPAGSIGKGIKLLESINRQIPGFLPAYLLLAKGKLAVGNDFDASLAITKVLQIDSRNQQGSILNAMIKNKKKDFQAAMNSLQEAISINFKIRQNPLFMLIKGQIQYQMGQYPTAQETMMQAMALPVVKKRKAEDPTSKKFKILSFSQKDRCSIYLLLAKCYAKNKKAKQSKQVMTQAIGQFAGTNQQVHVMLANAQISVQQGDIKKAMSILKQVKLDSPYFVQSRKVLADIHLKYLKSRKGYARCYYQIIEANPSFENYKIYGDALIRINQPEEAAIAYEKAYQEKSDNQLIIRDLGRAYALGHDYEKATKFYEDNIQKLNRPDLILDLAKLCVQLKRFERAETLLNNQIFNQEGASYDKLKQSVEAHFQLYKVHLKKKGKLNFDPNPEARKQIKVATQYQKMVIQKLRSQGGSADEEKLLYADLYYQIGNYSNAYEKDIDTAIMMLGQCLKINEQHEKALELLSTLYLRQGDMQKCEQTCKILLKVNAKNDQAGSLLAQVLLKQNQYDKAIEQFKKMLESQPDKYPVLAKLIDFFRRNNQLQEAKTYIQSAQSKANNTNDAGLCFCRGLYHKYSRNPTQALIQFNKAKKSHQYTQICLYHMIDIFLCPQQDLYYSAIDGRPKTVHPQNLRICESLLREMSTKATNDRYVVMQTYVNIMKGNTKQLQTIQNKLVDVLSIRSQFPPALLAMAMMKFSLGKDTQANNFLKICAKMNYQPEFGEQLQKAWLLSAQSYIKIQKFDNAQEILRMLLRQNKSCGKAQQYMGLIRQKQQAYADASDFYQRAFNLTSRKSPSIGYRLAYNYFKAKRYVQCLQICRQVLEVNPTYTSIKTDIQDKAIMAIR